MVSIWFHYVSLFHLGWWPSRTFARNLGDDDDDDDDDDGYFRYCHFPHSDVLKQ